MTERHALFDPILVGVMHGAGAPQVTASFRIFGLHQVPLASTGAQHLAARRDLETLGGGFFGLDAFGTSHIKSAFFQKERAI